MNRNVKLAFSVSFLTGLTRGIWAFTTLSLYLKLITQSTAQVGVAEGIQGSFQAVAAFAAGLAVDSNSRERVLQGGGLIGFFAIGCTLFGLYFEGVDDRSRFIVMCAALCLWGIYQGVWMTALDTLFADSVKTGQRSKLNTYRFILQQISGVTGPLIALLIFVYHDQDQESLAALRTVFTVGITLGGLPCLLLFFFRDQHALGLASESHYTSESDDRDYRLLEASEDANDEGEINAGPPATESKLFWSVAPAHVPYVTVVSDVVSGFGSGMTVKFFPLYFKEDLGLTPAAINLVYIGLAFFMIATSVIVRKVSKQCGQVQTIILFCYLGSLCLALMGLSSSTVYIVLPLYFMTTLVHSTRPLKKAVLMDFSEKRKRGWFNSFDSITRFGWSGSAILGGFSAETLGYQNLFLITAGVQFLSTSILWTLLGTVPKREVSRIPLDELDRT